jgi:hypothetical protein
LTGYMNSYGGDLICQLPVLAVRTLTDEALAKWPIAEESTHPLDFHDHDGDGSDRRVGFNESAEMASMEVGVRIVL